MQRCPGQRPQRCKRRESDRNLHRAAGLIGFAVGPEDFRPALWMGPQERTSGSTDVQYRVREVTGASPVWDNRGTPTGGRPVTPCIVGHRSSWSETVQLTLVAAAYCFGQKAQSDS